MERSFRRGFREWNLFDGDEWRMIRENNDEIERRMRGSIDYMKIYDYLFSPCPT
jgi:hypothetical protein